MKTSPLNHWSAWIMGSAVRFGWAPVLVLGTHLVCSKLTRIYAHWPHADAPMHFMGGVAIGFFFWKSVATPEGEGVLGALTLSGRGVLVASVGVASTMVWECAEWTTDRLGLTSAQAGLGDTMLDMALGASGAIFATAVGIAFSRSSEDLSGASTR